MQPSPNSTNFRVMLVDDEPTIQLTVADQLSAHGYQVTVYNNGEEAVQALTDNLWDVIVSDIRMPKMGGRELLAWVKTHQPEIECILMTGYADVSGAVDALKNGAYDYITKPFDIDELIARLERLRRNRALRQELEAAKEALRDTREHSPIVGVSPKVRQLRDLIRTIADSNAATLITGESGTGKELIARELHRVSNRSDAAFIPINCASLPENLLESELFGHEKGAFTGADQRRTGRFEAADKGIIFLDEVGEIPLNSQAKLLRVLQEGCVERVGSNQSIPVDVWVVSATNRNLVEMVEQGTFRQDLYYRLMVVEIEPPPLRERDGDLPILTEYFLKKYGRSGDKAQIDPEAWALLNQYSFPGNVRELEHAIRHALIMSRGETIQAQHLPKNVTGYRPRASSNELDGEFVQLSLALKKFEKNYIEKALELTEFKKSQAADLLGISRKSLWQKLKSFDIAADEADI